MRCIDDNSIAILNLHPFENALGTLKKLVIVVLMRYCPLFKKKILGLTLASLSYLPVYNAHFFPDEKAPEIEMSYYTQNPLF